MIAYVIEVVATNLYVERNPFSLDVTFTKDIGRAQRFLAFEEAARFHAHAPKLKSETVAVVPVFSTAASPCFGCG